MLFRSTGNTTSSNFPTTAGTGTGGGFVTKLSAAGSLVYSFRLGDPGQGITLDSTGNAYVVGSSLAPAGDVVVSKLNNAGTGLVFSTSFGGSGIDQGWGIALDSMGNVWITGLTVSADFPTVNAFQSGFTGLPSAFVAKLNAVGSLVHSSYLGGSGGDYGYEIGRASCRERV